MTRTEEAAKVFVDAIKTLASKPENLENLESYLSYSFQDWLSKYANTPYDLAMEMKLFAEIEI